MNSIEQQKTYWLRRVSEPPLPPNLPWDKERPPVSSFFRGTVSANAFAETWAGVKRLTERLNATPHAALLAALKTLLFRYTGQTDIIVGTLLAPTGEPARRELAASRAQLEGRSTAEDFVLQVAASIREGRDHLGVPFGALLEM